MIHRYKGWPQTSLVVLLSCAIYASYSLFRGQDINWDWQNYHDYDVFALLHGGYHRDADPAGIQTYLNPIIYIPAYMLRHHLPPRAAGLILGAVHGLNIALLWEISKSLLGRSGKWPVSLVATAIGATAPLTLSEVGTSFADLLTSIPVLGGIWLLLEDRSPPWYRPFAAGCLIGAAVGLKLTNTCFAAGAVVMVLVSHEPARRLFWLGAGGIAGALLMGGPWGLYLMMQFGNPVFPYYNAIFKSPDGPSFNSFDARWFPTSLGDAISYPFYWLIGDHRTAEVPFRDGRFATLQILFVAATIVELVKRARDRYSSTFSRMDLAFLGFVLLSFIMWMLQFSIQRYAVVLEMLSGPAIVLMSVRVIPAPLVGTVIAGLAVAIIGWTQPADWWHRRWSHPYIRSELPPELHDPATYFFLGKPLGIIATSAARGSRFYGMADPDVPIRQGGKLDRRIRDGLKRQLPGGVWAVDMGREPPLDTVKTYGLDRDNDRPCLKIPGVIFYVDAVACPLRGPAR